MIKLNDLLVFILISLLNNFFIAGAIANDDGAAEQPSDNGESETEAAHRVPVKLAKIEDRANVAPGWRGWSA